MIVSFGPIPLSRIPRDLRSQGGPLRAKQAAILAVALVVLVQRRSSLLLRKGCISVQQESVTDERGAIQALIQRGDISGSQVDLAYKQQRAFAATGMQHTLLDMLIRSRFVSREQISSIMGDEDRYAHISRVLLPRHVCVRYQVFPTRVDRGVLIVRGAAPLSDNQRKAIMAASLEEVSGIRVQATDRMTISRLIGQSFQEQLVLSDCLDRLRREEVTGDLVSAAVSALLTEALDESASDIHIDFHGDNNSYISYRIDGRLQRRFLMPKNVIGPLTMRIKSMCGMDSSERRRDQDGRLTHEYRGRSIDFRVSAIPAAPAGEGVVLRALDPDRIPSLSGMFPNQPKMVSTLQHLTRFQEKRGGLVVVSGVTGSGKSTTLHALTEHMPRDQINYMTVEDPVEFTLPLARQYQVNHMLNQSMAEIERAFLRQDLDAATVGEIRNQDSAKIAFAIAESGHLCFTTIHAKSATQTLHRLMNFFPSAEDRAQAAFIISQFCEVVLNQKLVNKLCVHCRVPVGENRFEANDSGCPRCNRGYKGRVLLHESLIIESDEYGRDDIYKRLLAGDFIGINQVPGVTHYSRATTAAILADTGAISTTKSRQIALEEARVSLDGVFDE